MNCSLCASNRYVFVDLLTQLPATKPSMLCQVQKKTQLRFLKSNENRGVFRLCTFLNDRSDVGRVLGWLSQESDLGRSMSGTMHNKLLRKRFDSCTWHRYPTCAHTTSGFWANARSRSLGVPLPPSHPPWTFRMLNIVFSSPLQLVSYGAAHKVRDVLTYGQILDSDFVPTPARPRVEFTQSLTLLNFILKLTHRVVTLNGNHGHAPP